MVPMVAPLQDFGVVAAVVGTFVACTVAYWYSSRKFNSSDDENYPVAPANLIEIAKGGVSKQVPFFLVEQAKKSHFSIYKLKVPKKEGIWIVGSGELARSIIVEPTHRKPSFIYKSFERILGTTNIFSSQTDAHWKQVRKGAAPAFSNKEINRMKDIAECQLDRWENERLKPLIESNSTFDPSIEMTVITFRVICEAAFEYDVSDKEIFDFFNNIKIAGDELCLKQMRNPLRKKFRFFIPAHHEAAKACKDLQGFSRNVLHAYRKKENKSTSNTVIKLIDRLEHLTEDEKVSELLFLIIAGHDTTGFTISNILYYLAKNQEVSRALREQLQSLGKDKWSDSSLLQHCIKETHRIMPVSALGTARKLVHDHHVKVDGLDFVLKEKAILFFPNLLLGRNPNVFSNPDKFDPYRWENPTPEMESNVLPFSVGPRNCLGYPLAAAEINKVVPRLIHDYNFEVAQDGIPEYFITQRIAGCQLRAIPIAAVAKEQAASLLSATPGGQNVVVKP